MTNPKVLLYSDRENEINEYALLLQTALPDIDLMVCNTVAEVNEKIIDAEIVFGVHLNPESYALAKKLRWIQSMWAGVEGLLRSPLPAGIVVTKPWGVFGRFLSHYVFGNLLAQKINLLGAYKLQNEKIWQPYRIELLHGRRICIAGLGDVAEQTAVIARGFGMEVWALNSDGRAHPLADQTFSREEASKFVSGADVLVLTLPSTPATRGMFNAELLRHLPADAWLINLGRGALIDDDALVKLLDEKRIAGAILDVFQTEPLPCDHPYWRLPNCIVTPHIGGPSLPADITACFVENFKRYKNSEPLLGLVDQSRGY